MATVPPERLGVMARLSRRFPRFVETYFAFDRRSLGLCRIYLGALLLYDLVRRVPGISTWYTNDGLLPNHTHLWRPAAPHMFSLLFAASTTAEAAVIFFLCGVAFTGLLVGYKTKVFHVLSFLGIVSLHSRCVFLENGGDVVLNLLCAWTLFLPMGDRFSVDALLASLRQRREHSVEELNDRTTLPRNEAPVISLAVLGILLELSVVYYFNALSKTGHTWKRGTAVHYVLYQERMVTWFGYLIRDHVTYRMSRFMTYSTLFLEATAPILILSPFGRRYTRLAAVILLPFMHLSFAVLLNVGMFSFNMIGFFPLLLQAADWEWLNRRFGPDLARARTVYFDDKGGLCSWWARVLVRLDLFGLLRFAPVQRGSDAVAETYRVEQTTTGRAASGMDAVIESVAALPAGLPAALGMRIWGVRDLLRWLYARISSKRETLSRRFDLEPLEALEPSTTKSPASRWLAWLRAWPREVAVVIFMVALTSQVLMENKIVPKVLKKGQKDWMIQIVAYPRLYQGWSMFTPDAPTGERMLYVDAITVDGRHIDPFNEAGSRVAPLPLEHIPEYMLQNEFWCDYTNRIPDNSVNWGPLKEWIFNYSERTGKAADRIVSYEARILENDNPPPGERGVRNIRTRVMAREHQ